MSRARVVFLGAVVVICAVTAWTGVAPLRLFEHDIFFLLDNGYRVAHGQVPHRDFSSATGPVMYLVEAAGLKLSGMQPEGVAYANALFGALLAVWAWRVSRSYLIGIYTLLLIVAPYALGWGALNYTYAMVYNRYAYALLGIVLVECATGELAISTGAACVLLASLKMSYALAAAPFVLFSAPFRKQRLVGLAIGAAAAALLVLAYMRFDVADMYRDLEIARRSKAWSFREMISLAFGPASLVEGALLVVLGAMVKGRKWLVFAIITVAAGGFLIATNHQPAGQPLVGYAALVLGGMYGTAQFHKALAAVCVAPLALQGVISLAGAAIEKHGRGLVFDPPSQLVTTETGGPAYQAVLDDGLALLRRRTGQEDGVRTMDMLNPFNYLLRRPSPRGGIATAAWNYMLSEQAHISPDFYFGPARFVMQRKYNPQAGDYSIENPNIAGLEMLYGPTLHERYSLIEETAHWRLYALNAPAGSR